MDMGLVSESLTAVKNQPTSRPEERVPGFVDDATQLRGSLWNPEPLVNRRSLTETLRKLDPCHLQGISHCRLWCLVVFVSTKHMYLQTENNRTHSLASHLPVPPSGTTSSLKHTLQWSFQCGICRVNLQNHCLIIPPILSFLYRTFYFEIMIDS